MTDDSSGIGNRAEDRRAAASERAEAKGYLLTGAGVAAIGAIGAVVGGAVCPVCIVATPTLVGLGLYKAWRGRRRERAIAAYANDPAQRR